MDKDKDKQQDEILRDATQGEYKYGFVSDIDTHRIERGLSEDVVRRISALKGEPNGCSTSA